MQQETTLMKVDGDDVTITTGPATMFRLIKALVADGRTVECKERGQWTTLRLEPQPTQPQKPTNKRRRVA